MASAMTAAHQKIASHTAGRSRVKCGIGKLTAVADSSSSGALRTRLTRVSHAAPTRLIPIRASSVERAGAALVAVSSYGGGMLQGDSSDLQVDVKEGAMLGLVTQGSNRIYKSGANSIHEASSLYPSGDEDATCRSSITARVAKNGLLVMAPDPCVAFSASSFVQHQQIHVQPGASVVLVDWFGAGRVCNGERWKFKRLSSRLSLYNDIDNENTTPTPFLVEAFALDQRFVSVQDPFGFDAGGQALEFNAFCSVILHGPAAESIVAHCTSLEKDLVAKHTRVRQVNDSSKQQPPLGGLDLLAMSGRVLMGVSEVLHDNVEEPTFVARLAATSNEDIYRVLHSCLQPLRKSFGVEFYRDRIQASATASTVPLLQQSRETPNDHETVQKEIDTPVQPPTPGNGSSPLFLRGRASWCAYMLADSGLPTGGFAHAAGIEAASQLGLFGNGNPDEQRVSAYIHAAARSTAQLVTPFVRAGRELAVSCNFDAEALLDQWIELDCYAHASMASNAPACRASLDQGESLLRVSVNWLQNKNNGRIDQDKQALLRLMRQCVPDSPQRGHLGPIFGIVCGLLGLDSEDACQVLGYCAARDMVSAAVRLNLVGPIASVSILDGAFDAVNDGINVSLAAAQIADQNGVDPLLAGVMTAATCSPVADAIHPCHDLLSVRLFRT